MSRFLLSGLLAFAVTAIGCTNNSGDPAAKPAVDAKPVTTAVPAAAAAAQSLEVACAGCVYKMAGAKGCTPAVKIADKTYHVDITGFSAHDSGLCSGPKKAQVTGELKGDRLVASKIELAK